MERDLTRGGIPGHLLAMSVPVMLGFLAQTLYDLVDLFWIGRLPAASAALGGVTIFLQLLWVVEFLNQVIGMSSVSLISQSFGAGRLERTRTAIEQTLIFKALVALAAGLLGFAVLRPVVGLYSRAPEVVGAALSYGRLRLLTLPLMFSSYSVITALRSIGDARRPMYILLVCAVLNAVLDPLLMFERVPGLGLRGLGLGVFGASLATVLATALSFALGLWFLFAGRTRVRLTWAGLLRLDAEMDRKLLTIGLPAGAENLVRNGAQAAVLKVVSLYGTAAVAALGIVYRLFNFALMVLVGLHMGAGTVAGQNLGAERLDRARSACRSAALLGLALMLLLGAAAWTWSRPLLELFTTDAQTVALGLPLLRIFCLALLFLAFTFGLGSAFGAAGFNLPFLVSSLASKLGFQLPFLLLLRILTQAPLSLVWGSFLGTEIVELAVVWGYYRSGRWLKVRV
jgi:putative MATE family efflux protein